MSLKSRVLTGLKWVTATRFLIQIITWGITLIVIRILTPADYGLLAMASVFTGLVMLFAQGGVGMAVIQAVNVGETELRQAFTLVIVINVILFTALFASAPLIAEFFEEARLVLLVRVLSIQFLVQIFSVLPGALLARNLDFKASSMAGLVSSVTGGCATLVLALVGEGVWALVWGSLISAIVSAICMNIASPFFLLPSLSGKGVMKLLSYGGHVTLSRVLSFIYLQGDIFIAGKVLGKELLGFYTVAMQVSSLPVQKVSAILNPITLTAFARVQEQTDRFAGYLLRSATALFLMSLPVCWGMSSIAEELIPILLGPKWEEAMMPFKLLALIMPLRILSPFINSANFGMGRADIVTTCVLILACAMLPAYLLGVQWEVIGLTLAWVLAFPCAFAAMLTIALPSMGLSVRQMLRGLVPTLASGAGMYLAVTLSRMALPAGMPEAGRVIVLIAVGATTFAALTGAINREGFRDAVALLRR